MSVSISTLYVSLKVIASIFFFIGALITLIVGRKRQAPYYTLWVLFLVSYGLFEIVDALEFLYDALSLYRLFQIFQALSVILLFAACLEQSLMLTPKASRILTASLFTLSVYFILIPLRKMIVDYKSITIYLFHFFPTDIYGLAYGLFVLASACFLVPILIRYIKSARLTRDPRMITRRNVTLLVIMMLIGLSVIIAMRREMNKNGYLSFYLVDNLYSILVITLIAFFQAQSMSHGLSTIILVDSEGNPILGYSPQTRRRISFEEKIIAASGYLAGLFHFVKEYVASTSEEQFKEVKTTSSTLAFYSAKKYFLIVQTKISSEILDQTASQVLNAIEFYLKDLKSGELPIETQINDILHLIDTSFYLLA